MKKFALLITALSVFFTLSACQAPAEGSFPTARQTELPNEPVPMASAPAESVSQSTKPTDPVMLTAQQAKEIALAHAGLTADQVRLLRADFDIERGVPKFEVEFTHDRWEYEYDIHAETGKILSFEKDR